MENLLKIELEISEEKISELLTTAFYGAVNYWAVHTYCKIPDHVRILRIPFEDSLAMCLMQIPGYYFEIWENDETEIIKHKIDLEKIKKGLRIMAKKDSRFYDFLEDGFDAEIADITIQYICFGEIIYG